ncbi:hypothetical protein KJ564_08665 [bacterium]|nr:hypothetical protein [bacterium]
MNQSRKEHAKSFLIDRNWQEMCAWAQNDRGAGRQLSSLLLDNEPLIRWRAIEALGQFAILKAQSRDLELIRRMMRRLMWGMNDESGSVIWNAPEAMAEMAVCVPKLIDKYAEIVAAHYDLEPFPRGVHWGMARIASVRAGIFADFRSMLKNALHNDDAYIRAHASLTLGRMGETSVKDRLQELTEDQTPFEVYDLSNGNFRTATVSEYAQEALELLP